MMRRDYQDREIDDRRSGYSVTLVLGLVLVLLLVLVLVLEVLPAG
jgi:hypothetical protein